MSITGVVLAGGLSRRMGGREKSLIELGGKTLIERVARRLSEQTKQVVINANGDPFRFETFDLPIAADVVQGNAGPLAGILTGLMWARENAPDTRFVASAAADTPFFPSGLVSRMTDALLAQKDPDGAMAISFTNGRLHPVFGVWPVALTDDLHRFLVCEDNRKVLAFVDRHGLVQVNFDDVMEKNGYDPFFNVNTPEDLKMAEELLGGKQT